MRKVLIVDDDITLQTALTRRLKAQGFEVANATSAVEALEMIDQEMPDVVVSDVLMPTMDGFEFCRRLRSDPAGQMVPFIFLSSLAEVENRVLGHTIGADDYLVKPFHPRELIAKINGLINRSKLIHDQLEQMMRRAAETDGLPPEPQMALPLTPAEEKVFWEVIQGYTNKQIGDRLFISPRTVQTHLSNILSKLSLENRSQLIRFAFENGYQPPKDAKASPE